MKEPEQRPLLEMTRFCGKEYYPVESATWCLHEDSGEEKQLWLEIEMGEGINLSEDTTGLCSEPFWELTLRSPLLHISSLVKGFKAEIPEGHNDTNFYYCEHEPSDNNIIEIMDTNEDGQLKIRLSATIQDVNYYDGSKPASLLFLDTWFSRRT